MNRETVYVAVMMFGSLIDSVNVYREYKDAFDAVVEFVGEGMEFEDIEFDFENLKGSKYEGTTIYTTTLE